MTHDELRLAVKKCFALNSLPRSGKDRSEMRWVIVGQFQFQYDIHSTGEGLCVNILHPDGSRLDIIKQSYCSGPSPDWVCWKRGAWDDALVLAYEQMVAANTVAEARRDENVRLMDEREAKRKAEETAKFESLFRPGAGKEEQG